MSTELLETPARPEELTVVENGRRYEWIDGEWVEKPMGAEASLIAVRIRSRMNLHAEAHQLGFVLDSETGYQIFPEKPKRTVFADGSFHSRGQFPDDRIPKGHIQLVPRLMLEVVSPNDLAYEVEKKVADYLRVGVQLLWAFYPNTHTIMIYRQGGNCSRLTEADQLTGEAVLPGFSCSVAELFAGI